MAGEAPVPAPAAGGGKKLPVKSIGVLVLLMLLEGGAFATWIALSKPHAAIGAEPEKPVASKVVDPNVELKILECRAPNTKTGKTYLYDMEVVVEVPKEKQALVEAVNKQRAAYILDALATIVRKADPQHLQEPDLETLRRQIRAALVEVFGEDAIVKVLIPRCTPYRAE